MRMTVLKCGLAALSCLALHSQASAQYSPNQWAEARRDYADYLNCVGFLSREGPISALSEQTYKDALWVRALWLDGYSLRDSVREVDADFARAIEQYRATIATMDAASARNRLARDYDFCSSDDHIAKIVSDQANMEYSGLSRDLTNLPE